jgi:hypothetical protein
MAEVEIVDPIDAIDDIVDDVAEESGQEEVQKDAASTTEQPRDEDGRVVETDATSDDAAAPAEITEEVEETSTDADQQVEKEQPAEPFSYQGDGQTHVIDGSKVGEDGSVTIPKDQVPHIQTTLAAGKYHVGNWQRERNADKQAVEAANAERDAQVAKSNAISEKLNEIAGLDENQLIEWALQFQREMPVIQAKAEQEAIEAQAKADKDKLAAYQQAEYERQMLPQMEAGVKQYVEQYGQEERFKGLTEQDRADVANNLWANWQAYNLFVADGGEIKVQLAKVEEALMYAAKFRRQEAVKEKKATEAKEVNKVETAKETKKPPPILSTKGGPQPKGKVEGSVVDAIREKHSVEDQTDAIDEWFENEDFDDD